MLTTITCRLTHWSSTEEAPGLKVDKILLKNLVFFTTNSSINPCVIVEDRLLRCLLRLAKSVPEPDQCMIPFITHPLLWFKIQNLSLNWMWTSFPVALTFYLIKVERKFPVFLTPLTDHFSYRQ